MAGERSIQHVSNQDTAEIDGWVELGMGIMAHYGVEQSDSIYDNLDNVYFAWANETSPPYSDEQVQVGLGAVFGSRLSYKHGSQWQRVVDAYGSDYALTIKGREIYPISFVGKRIATLSTPEPESGFFSGMDAVIDSW